MSNVMRRPEIRRVTPRCSRGRSSQQGVSLIESLIATVLLAFVAIAIFPMLHRSVASNISGSDSNQATHHGLSELERLLSLPFDSPVFEMEEAKRLPDHQVQADGSGDRMLMGTRFFDARAKADPPASPKDKVHHIATGEWISERGAAYGLVVWRRSGVIRQYSYADIGEGVIDASDSGQVISEGHPKIFDSPLKQDALDSQINFKEEEVTVDSLRAGAPSLRTKLSRAY